MQMRIERFTFNAFSENTFIVADDAGKCAIIDPGNSNAEEDNALISFIEENGLNPICILQSHCHIDHILGNASLVSHFNIPIVAHSLEQFNVERAASASLMWGIDYKPTPTIDYTLDSLQPVDVGSLQLEVRFTPGHAQGHVVFIHHESKQIIAGDGLFMGSVGRVDLPGSNASDLVQSIQQELYSLPDDYIVHCGHGPSTTIGREKQNNAFVKENWSALG